jgi:hypothetical protein
MKKVRYQQKRTKMAQTTSNGEWLEAIKQTRAECEIAQDKQNRMVPTLTKETKDITHNQ